jgi:hypothetical protein
MAEGSLGEQKALELLRIDADWLTPDSFAQLATLVGTRDLRKLAASPDPSVRKNAWALLVALAPHKYTPKAMKTALYLAFESNVRLGLAIEYGGDPVLDAVYTELRAEWRSHAIGDLIPWLRSVETERARAYLRVHLDHVGATIRESMPPGQVLEEICFLTDADMAERVADAIRTHGIFYEDREELIPSLQGLLDLSGLAVHARGIVEEAVEACPFPGPAPEEPEEAGGPFDFGRGSGR